jgi:hypothetical protein
MQFYIICLKIILPAFHTEFCKSLSIFRNELKQGRCIQFRNNSFPNHNSHLLTSNYYRQRE